MSNMKRQLDSILDRAFAIADADEMLGICINCQNEQMAEPDARAYTCEDCGKAKVYGATEIVISNGMLQ